MLEHEDGVLLRILELLEEQQRLLVVTETPLDTVSCTRCNVNAENKDKVAPLAWQRTRSAITDKHSVVLPVVIVDLVLLQCRWEHLPCRIIQADFKALEVVLTVLALWTSRYGIGL